MKSIFLTGWIFLLSFALSWAITAQEEGLLVRQTLSMFGGSSADLVEPSAPPIRTCGTATLMEAKRRFSELSPASQALLRPVLQSRPSLPFFFDVPLLTGQSGPGFRVHYTKTGSDSVRNASTDLRGFGSAAPNGVPDWVDTVGLVLDSAWIREVGQLGFRPPESDGFYPSGDGPRFDVYLQNLGALFLGGTFPDSAGGILLNRSTAFIVLHSTFNVAPYSGQQHGPQRAMRVTAAHEFFHAIQFAYNAFGSEVQGPYWYEATAVWMEEQVYNDINDYIQYLPFWFRSPELSFRTFSNNFGFDPDRAYRPYASGIYGLYLSKRFPNPPYGTPVPPAGHTVVRKIWENMATSSGFNLFSAIDGALATVGSNFLASLQEFYQWNYFVGPGSHLPLNVQFYGSESATWPTFDQFRAVDSTDAYPTSFPTAVVYGDCNSCPKGAVSFFHSDVCRDHATFPPRSCSTVCPPSIFVPYNRENSLFCLDYVEDLGATYLNLQNPGSGSFVDFSLLADTSRFSPWFLGAAGYDTGFRDYTFLTGQTTDPSGEIQELFFPDFGNYTEVVVMVMNNNLLPTDANRISSTYAYSANVDSSAPPGQSLIKDARPNPFRPGIDPKVKIPVELDSLSGNWTIDMTVYSADGEIVFQDEEEKAGGYRYNRSVNWDGYNIKGEPAASGIYFCKVIMKENGTGRKVEKVLKVAVIRSQ